MASLKMNGDLAELRVAAHLLEHGYKIAIPYGEDWDFDLIIERHGALERVQVKYAKSNGDFIPVRCRSHSLTNGKVRRTKRYTAATIDWLAVYDKTTDRCYYIPASELGHGRALLHLRLSDPLNSQRLGIRFASDYTEPQSRQTRLEEASGPPGE
jgi:PD-(D/E)XK nuclease superfamily protein